MAFYLVAVRLPGPIPVTRTQAGWRACCRSSRALWSLALLSAVRILAGQERRAQRHDEADLVQVFLLLVWRVCCSP